MLQLILNYQTPLIIITLLAIIFRILKVRPKPVEKVIDGTIYINIQNPEFDQYTLEINDELESLHAKDEVILRIHKTG